MSKIELGILSFLLHGSQICTLIYSLICSLLEGLYCSDCLQQKRPNQNLLLVHISQGRGPLIPTCVMSNHHLIYSLKLN